MLFLKSKNHENDSSEKTPKKLQTQFPENAKPAITVIL